MLKKLFLTMVLLAGPRILCAMQAGPSNGMAATDQAAQPCPICMLPIDQTLPVDTPQAALSSMSLFEPCACTCFYHAACIIHWVETRGRRAACPTCRAPLRMALPAHLATLVEAALGTHTAAAVPLIEAVRADDMAQLHALFAQGVNVNAPDEYGRTALMLAAELNRMAMMTALLAHPAIAVNARDIYAMTALILAAHWGHVGIVRVLLAHGADVNAQHDCGTTALIRAAELGYARIVNELLRYPAIAVNMHDGDGTTALMSATHWGSVEIVTALLAYPGIEVNACNNAGQTALSYAAPGSAIAQLLIEHGAYA